MFFKQIHFETRSIEQASQRDTSTIKEHSDSIASIALQSESQQQGREFESRLDNGRAFSSTETRKLSNTTPDFGLEESAMGLLPGIRKRLLKNCVSKDQTESVRPLPDSFDKAARHRPTCSPVAYHVDK